MKCSRRRFLGTATGAAVSLLSIRPIPLNAYNSPYEREPDCVLLDLNSHCALRESLQGFQSALIGEHNLLPVASLNSRRRCRIAIVPGLGMLDPTTARILSGLLKAGTTLLLESGAGFLSPAEFATHQRMLHRYFDVAIDLPVDLWPGESAGDSLLTHRPGRHSRRKMDSHAGVPYVSYLWPRETKVRDFSRVIPVSARGRDVIGKVGALPVALKRRVSMGTLIFLGSPMGPALRAGDSEAQSWLRLVTEL